MFANMHGAGTGIHMPVRPPRAGGTSISANHVSEWGAYREANGKVVWALIRCTSVQMAGRLVMDTADIDRIERAQACLRRKHSALYA